MDHVFASALNKIKAQNEENIKNGQYDVAGAIKVIEIALDVLDVLKRKLVDLSMMEYCLERYPAPIDDEDFRQFCSELPGLTEDEFHLIRVWLENENEKIKIKSESEQEPESGAGTGKDRKLN